MKGPATMDDTIKALLKECKKYFYKSWYEEPTEAEQEYYKNYFAQDPTRGNYEEFYNKALSPRTKVYFIADNYNNYCDPEVFIIPADIDRLKQEIEETKQYYI